MALVKLATPKSELVKLGRLGEGLVLATFRGTTSALGASQDAIKTGFSSIEAVLGHAVIGDTPAVQYATATVQFVADPTATDTFTVGGVVYTFLADPTSAEYAIDVIGTEADQAQAFADAINRGSDGNGPGSDYNAGIAPNPDVVAIDVTTDTVTLRARVPGAHGNSLALETDMTDTTEVVITAFSGGSDAPVLVFNKNAEGVTDAEGDVAGDIGVSCNQASIVFEVTVLARP